MPPLIGISVPTEGHGEVGARAVNITQPFRFRELSGLKSTTTVVCMHMCVGVSCQWSGPVDQRTEGASAMACLIGHD
jgi:hypothetical protein